MIQENSIRFTVLTISDSILGQTIEKYITFKKVPIYYPKNSYRSNTFIEWENVFSFTPYSPNYQQPVEDYNYNIFGKEIVRYDLGYMIGAMLSWISIFSLFFAFVVGPIMDAASELKQTEAIFHLTEALGSPSILKYIAASFRSGLFAKEDRYVALAERLSQLKNVGAILKLQQTIRCGLIGPQ
jgi:hypothetical protein